MEQKKYKDFEVVINKNYTLELKLSIWQQEHLAHALKEVWESEEKYNNWKETDSYKKLPKAEKDKYEAVKINMMHSRSLLVHLLHIGGVNDEWLAGLMALPF